MRRFVGLVVLALLCLPGAAAVHAANLSLPNAGFETGDLTGWTSMSGGGAADVVTSFKGITRTYAPAAGNYFLTLHGGNFDQPQIVYQHVTMNAGDTFAGWAAFDAEDASPYNDKGGVVIMDSGFNYVDTAWGGMVSPPLYEQISGPWTPFSWTATSPGDYIVLYAAAEEGGNATSYVLFDAGLNRPTSTPEPGTMALLLMGLPMAGLLRRRRHSC